ncbi:MAG TPA: lytic transglycosylase domain-containing protein [Rhizomicrobium sp.]|nr:lytic transglycosylase domain-containing protein [Rhizomicrobium sp.]
MAIRQTLLSALALGSMLAGARAADVAVLSPDDVARYRQIFADERRGDFADAREQVARLTDRSLIGYAEAEHYLSPHSGRSSVGDMVEWLNAYKDLPVADSIYDLAIERARKPVRRHHRIVGYKVTVLVPTPSPAPRARGGGYEDGNVPDPPMSADSSRQAQSQIEADIRSDQPAEADGVLQALAAADTAPGADVARLSQRVAASYLAEGMDFNAFDVASRPAGYDRMSAPLLDWDAGFAAYRMGKYDVAAQHFETLAQVGSVPNYIRSQAAFWAARAHLAEDDPLPVVSLLTAAAREQPTFYGMLAQRMLGLPGERDFADPVVAPSDFATLDQIPSFHRAVALYQIGETDWLHEEMQRAMAVMDMHGGETYAAVAHRMNLPDLELRASETVAARGRLLTGLFPVPGYAPQGGYRLDPALLLAFTREESKFQANAVSPAGAHGLMQLMPGTAAKLAGGSVSNAQLHDPSFNMSLGQRYLEELLDDHNGNIVEIAAAYNAGPGSINRWLGTKATQHDDPLLFIESIPVQATRTYVKVVLTYYWMYDRRDGRDATTLEQTAEGGWPVYRRGANLAQPAPQPDQAPKPVVVSDASY